MRNSNKAIMVSVIIANFNGEKFLGRCLQSLFVEKEKGFEVLVVDDGSTDTSLDLLRKDFSNEKRLKVIKNKINQGAAESRNIGFQRSCGNILLFLDTDTKIKPGWFKACTQFFEANPKVGLAQAKLLKMGTKNFDYAGDLLSPFGFLIERAREAPDTGQFDTTDRIFAFKSAALLARREVFSALGGFDKDYHIFWEDTDLAWRAWLAGSEVRLAPNIVVWHAYGTEEKNHQIYVDNKVVYHGCRNMLISLIKNLGIARLIIILPINIVCWLTLAVLFLIRQQPKNYQAIIRAIIWNIGNTSSTLKKRKRIQSERKISDHRLFSLVGYDQTLAYYFGKAKAYIAGKPF